MTKIKEVWKRFKSEGFWALVLYVIYNYLTDWVSKDSSGKQ